MKRLSNFLILGLLALAFTACSSSSPWTINYTSDTAFTYNGQSFNASSSEAVLGELNNGESATITVGTHSWTLACQANTVSENVGGIDFTFDSQTIVIATSPDTTITMPTTIQVEGIDAFVLTKN